MPKYFVSTDDLCQLLSDLIRINSVNPSLAINRSGESRIASFICEYLDGIGVNAVCQTIKTNRINVMATIPGSGGGNTLLLNGHTDTVSAEKMQIDPFDPQNIDGKVYGRGALDMKAGIAAQMMAVQILQEYGIQLKGDLILSFVADEEYASIGTEEMVKTIQADAAIICEPTNLELVIAHKGFAWARIEVLGKAAHGSLPEEGVDAIVKAGKVLTGLETLSLGKYKQTKHALLGNPSVHASMVQGGIGLSTYPDYCKIELERRTLPGENKETIEAELQDLLVSLKKDDPQFQANLDVFFYRSAYEISQNQAIIRALGRAVEKIQGQPPKFSGMSGWIESALLADAGIPTVIFGPAGEGLHAAVEWVDLNSVVRTTEILIQAILDFCGFEDG